MQQGTTVIFNNINELYDVECKKYVMVYSLKLKKHANKLYSLRMYIWIVKKKQGNNSHRYRGSRYLGGGEKMGP